MTVWCSVWSTWTCMSLMKPRGLPIASNSLYAPPVVSAVSRISKRTFRWGTSITSPGLAIPASSPGVALGHMRRTTVLGCIVPLIFFAAVPAAEAVIQIDQGISGARIGNTVTQVRAALGKPKSSSSGSNDFGPFLRYTYDGGLRVLFQGKTNVSSVEMTGKGDRTPTGVGVGSTEAAADALPGVKCETIAGFRSCHTGAFTAGKRVTDFEIKSGKVTRVVVGNVID